jgi:hypothetical protein
VVVSARLPGGLALAFNLLRFKPMRRLPATWGWMTKRPVPPEIMDAWFRPAVTSAEVHRGLRKYVLSVPPKAELLAWSEALRTFDRPCPCRLGRGGPRDAPSHGRRLAELLQVRS